MPLIPNAFETWFTADAGASSVPEDPGALPLKRAKSQTMQTDLNRTAAKRQERIQQIRQMIREQRYESEMKLEIAISRLLNDID